MQRAEITDLFADAMLDSAHAVVAEHGIAAGRMAARGMINGGAAALRAMIGDGAALGALWAACQDFQVEIVDDGPGSLVTTCREPDGMWDALPTTSGELIISCAIGLLFGVGATTTSFILFF